VYTIRATIRGDKQRPEQHHGDAHSGPSPPAQWAGYAGANLLVAGTDALIGVIIGPLLGKGARVFVAFLIPLLDLGIIQSPMLRPEPQQWARFLSGYGSTKVLSDTGLTAHFDETWPLLMGLAWLGVVYCCRADIGPRAIRCRTCSEA
jgi:hypothetical protein